MWVRPFFIHYLDRENQSCAVLQPVVPAARRPIPGAAGMSTRSFQVWLRISGASAFPPSERTVAVVPCWRGSSVGDTGALGWQVAGTVRGGTAGARPGASVQRASRCADRPTGPKLLGETMVSAGFLAVAALGRHGFAGGPADRDVHAGGQPQRPSRTIAARDTRRKDTVEKRDEAATSSRFFANALATSSLSTAQPIANARRSFLASLVFSSLPRRFV